VYDTEKLSERIAKLSGGVAVIKVRQAGREVDPAAISCSFAPLNQWVHHRELHAACFFGNYSNQNDVSCFSGHHMTDSGEVVPLPPGGCRH
jgi:hypothetical protein